MDVITGFYGAMAIIVLGAATITGFIFIIANRRQTDPCKICRGSSKKEVILFDTLKFVTTLRDAGVPYEQAVAMCQATHDAWREIAETTNKASVSIFKSDTSLYALLMIYLIISILTLTR